MENFICYSCLVMTVSSSWFFSILICSLKKQSVEDNFFLLWKCVMSLPGPMIHTLYSWGQMQKNFLYCYCSNCFLTEEGWHHWKKCSRLSSSDFTEGLVWRPDNSYLWCVRMLNWLHSEVLLASSLILLNTTFIFILLLLSAFHLYALAESVGRYKVPDI